MSDVWPVAIIAAVILFLFKDSLFGKEADTEQPVIQTENMERESLAESEEPETPEETGSEEMGSEEIEADS